MTRDELEKAIEDKVTKGEMPCGLYDAGVVFVSVYLGGEEFDTVEFEWFESPININEYITEEKG